MSEALEAIERQARRGPDSPALVVGEQVLTYRSLVDTAAELAGRLVAAGVEPGTAVVLFLPQGAAALVGVLATLRAGASFAVVDPDHPAERLDSVLEVADCAAIVHLGAVRGPLRDVERPPPLVEFTARGRSRPDRPVAADGRHPAYLLHTPVPAGRPKTIVITRSNLDAAITGHTTLYGPAPVVLPALPVSDDGVLGALFATLASGGTLVLPDARELADPRAVAALATRHRTTHLLTTPSSHHRLLDRADLLPATLDLCLLHGEPVTPDLVARHRASLPRTRVTTVHGPAEATIACLAHAVTGSPKWTIPLGRPLAGTTILVLDPHLRPVPPGEVGELYVGGAAVGPGYACDPGRTAERFVANPAGDGTTVYRTGDLVSVDPTGTVVFHGRATTPIKAAPPAEEAVIARPLG
ncbi:AMP-binding protein [Umezawaea sp.]|uniref:AMP-binding protein n=1 Tax=Umezawaea sp. TaxID=1955258 RepID=UPI002ED19A07